MADVIVRAQGSPKRLVEAETPTEAVGKDTGTFRVNGEIISNPSTYELGDGDVVDHTPVLKGAC
jgi:hypothetical protein